MAKTIRITRSTPRKPRAAARKPTYQQIQLRAYEIYLQRRGAPGDEVQDWLLAERELVLAPKRSSRTPKTARPAKPEAA